ncbi:hypothetical protein ILYODFUR_009897 [Ilyodon furcidens]|uniref:Secreted protein n=1 Tax=Ilyodon furcidens TaxID=33524 RepID=A0ABV0U433_9TELE
MLWFCHVWIIVMHCTHVYPKHPRLVADCSECYQVSDRFIQIITCDNSRCFKNKLRTSKPELQEQNDAVMFLQPWEREQISSPLAECVLAFSSINKKFQTAGTDWNT